MLPYFSFFFFKYNILILKIITLNLKIKKIKTLLHVQNTFDESFIYIHTHD